MRAYNWPADVKDSWFVNDQIHFTSEGYRMRARYIADALLKAFPATGGPTGTNSRNCVIGEQSPSGPKARRA